MPDGNLAKEGGYLLPDVYTLAIGYICLESYFPSLLETTGLDSEAFNRLVVLNLANYDWLLGDGLSCSFFHLAIKTLGLIIEIMQALS